MERRETLQEPEGFGVQFKSAVLFTRDTVKPRRPNRSVLDRPWSTNSDSTHQRLFNTTMFVFTTCTDNRYS